MNSRKSPELFGEVSYIKKFQWESFDINFYDKV